MEQTLDRLLARHCAPALLGVKPANLVSLPLEEYRLLAPQIAWYSHVLRQRGLCFLTLDRRCKTVLLLIYSPAELKRHLEQESCRQMLSQAGYPSEGLSEKLLFLQSRLAENQDFPHEIGLFLGYPPRDVLAFQQNQGRCCKLCGYWKVYSGLCRARLLFRRYDSCRDYLCSRVARGETIPQVLKCA